jgi:hypothetical protein
VASFAYGMAYSAYRRQALGTFAQCHLLKQISGDQSRLSFLQAAETEHGSVSDPEKNFQQPAKVAIFESSASANAIWLPSRSVIITVLTFSSDDC